MDAESLLRVDVEKTIVEIEGLKHTIETGPTACPRDKWPFYDDGVEGGKPRAQKRCAMTPPWLWNPMAMTVIRSVELDCGITVTVSNQ